MEKDLRLIANITIDEEQKFITIDKDINQKPFALMVISNLYKITNGCGT